jgi:flagellar protein FliO/FliZ
MDAFDALRASGALLLTLALLLGGAWALRRFGSRYLTAGRPRVSDLGVIEWKALDARRRLAVIRWDGREHLLCLGPAGDAVIASRPTPSSPAEPSS